MLLNTLHILADFHSLDGPDRLVVSTDFVQGAALFLVPTVGDRVLLDDGEGHNCWASVTDVHWPLLDVCVDWATWRKINAFEVLESPSLWDK